MHRDDKSQKIRVATAAAGSAEAVMKKIEKSADGSAVRETTKTDRFSQSGDDLDRFSLGLVFNTHKFREGVEIRYLKGIL